MRYLFFIILLSIGISPLRGFAYSSSSLSSWSNTKICEYATSASHTTLISWSLDKNRIKYLVEAKKRGVDCNVNAKTKSNYHIKRWLRGTSNKEQCFLATTKSPNSSSIHWETGTWRWAAEIAQKFTLQCDVGEKRIIAKKPLKSSIPSSNVISNTQFNPDETKSFYCPDRKKVFGRQSARNCLNALTSACDRTYSRQSNNAQSHAHRVNCYLKSINDEFPNERDLGLVTETMRQGRAIYVMAAQGALSLSEARQLADRLGKEMDRELASRDQVRRNQGLKTAMLGFCIAQGNSINSCMGVPRSGNTFDIEDHGILKKSVVNGSNRICVYDKLGSEFAVTVEATDLCSMSRLSPNQESSFASSGGYLLNSYVDGFNRVCVYDNAGSLFMRTVASTDICEPSL